ncbi:hypothetical protein [Limnohabitans sp.]|uniref:hypothetical protein n=1 Tax=Limnohabitans sp. TaxID=1907725 RepID=UPI00286EE8E3|nr:hypothetical protein [Limnohabitans sp.]
MLEYLIFTVLFAWCFYALYVMTMGVYRAKLSGRLTGVSLALLYPFVLVSVFVDVLCQLTLANVIFLEMPLVYLVKRRATLWRWSFDLTYIYIEPLVTSRLQRLHMQDDGWRGQLAASICDKLLDVFDPDGDHC